MKKFISILISAVMMMSLALGVYAQGNSSQSNGNGWGEKANLVIGSKTIDFDDELNDLKDQMKKLHKDKKLRKQILKELKKQWKKSGDDSIPVIVNGEVVEFDVTPVIKYGRTLIPVRAVTEALGADVKYEAKYNETTKKYEHIVTITKTVDSQLITVVINLDTGVISKNGEVVTFEVKPQLVNNRTMVPIRFLAEIFGMDVEYDEDSHGVFCDDDEDEDEDEDEVATDTVKPVLLKAEAISDISVVLTFSEAIKNTFALSAGDIIITDGSLSQNPVTAKISSTTSTAVVITTTSLDAYDFSMTTIKIAADEIKDKASNGNILTTTTVQDKYAKAATAAAIVDIDSTAGITGADIFITWAPASDNTIYYDVYLFKASDKYTLTAIPSTGVTKVGMVVSGTNFITISGNTDSKGQALVAQSAWVNDTSGYEAYVVAYDAYGNKAISAVGVNAAAIINP